jgi:hypothetical protein
VLSKKKNNEKIIKIKKKNNEKIRRKIMKK